jgi:four helix bundle protein
MELAVLVYAYSDCFPDSERFGLTSQMRRAVVSIPSNIAEGAARRSTPEYIRFLSMARGSLAELDTQLHLSERLLSAIPDKGLAECLNRTFARLNALIASLEKRLSEDPTPYLVTACSAQSPIPNPQSHAR